MTDLDTGEITAAVTANLPFLRRYARALTGSRDVGDTYAAAALEAILSDFDRYNKELPPKVALFQVFHSIWVSSGATFVNGEEVGLAARAQKRLAALTNGTREALLLHTIEDFSHEDVGRVLGISEREARSLTNIAVSAMAKEMSGRVMIVEDEAIIALDLEAIVAEMGHGVTGVARTADAALDLFEKDLPDLVLSDIQLADGSNGIDAVSSIMKTHPDLPVIYITAFPERLLTGEGDEPTFLIPKPYTEAQVRSAVSQAMFFLSTESLVA